MANRDRDKDSTSKGKRNWSNQKGWSRGKNFWRGRGRGQNVQQRNFHTNTSTNERLQSLDNTDQNCKSPFRGWRLYFPNEPFNKHSSLDSKIRCCQCYLEKRNQCYNKEEIYLKKSFVVDFKDLASNYDVSDEWDNFQEEMTDNPASIINSLGLAMFQIISESHNADSDSELSEPDFKDIIHCRITNFSPTTLLRDVRASYFEKFICVKGTVARVSNIKPGCVQLAFECNTCGSVQIVKQLERNYSIPKKCRDEECKGQMFTPLRNHAKTNAVDCQSIRLQELLEDENRESGRVPRIIECELTNDLTDSCIPGDIVTVCGIVKFMAGDDNKGRFNKDRSMFLLYIQANSLSKSKSGKVYESETNGSFETDLMPKLDDLYVVEEIQARSNLFRILVQSWCPAIYGHEMVKAGLLLGFFGGTTKFQNDRNCIPVRGDIHILMVGDPGLGKSQMLQACANTVPRGVYVCGNTSTVSGLTVTLTKEPGSSEYSFEAGALVLADQGCCCIDEFDKMGLQHQALLEAMEQQSISIAKAGIVCSLPARSAIFAAANPVGGSYNKAKTVSENLKMSGAILSRFDLVFILVDRSNEEHDNMLSEHIMAIHSANDRTKKKAGTLLIPASALSQSQHPSADSKLKDRLKMQPGEEAEIIPHFVMRKYIAYARQYIHPKLSPEAASALQHFYLDLRKKYQVHDSTPITTRQLESLIRLAEARAKVELRETVSLQDAKDVIEIMKFSMIETCLDEHGNLDFKRSQHGSGMSKQAQTKKFISVLSDMSESSGNKIYSEQQLKDIMIDCNLQIKDPNTLISKLNVHGFLLKKGTRKYQLQI